METLNTVIEFVGTGTGGATGNAAATDSSATADPLFTILAVLIAIATIGVALFLYARHNKMAAASATALHARQSISENCAQPKNNIASKALIAVIGIIIAATCFAICGHNNAFAEENSSDSNGIAAISDKVKAHVDDSGSVTFDKGIITNNDGELSVGMRHLKSSTTVDLSDSTLQITCNGKELFNKTLGDAQLNDSYITVPSADAAVLIYSIKIPAEKAKTLIGTQPITLSTDVDLVVSKKGSVEIPSNEPVKNASVTYSYTDPYEQTKLVCGQTITDENGNYTIPDVKKGSKVTIEASYMAGGKEYYTKTDPISFDDEKTEILPVVLKEKITYKPIQTTVDDTVVTFLPAYNGTDPGCKFYTKSGENYTEIEGITDMTSLATKINAAGAANVYTDASGKTFFGTIDRSWDEAFKSDTEQGKTSKGLNLDFKAKLNAAGVKTVYFKTNESEEALSEWNWDANDDAISQKSSPILNGVTYGTSLTTTSEFYGAYKDLLSNNANYPWSSRFNCSVEAYGWYVATGNWYGGVKDDSYAVVLSKSF